MISKENIEYSLSEFIDIKHGYAYKGKFFSHEETNFILLTPGNFKAGGGFQGKKFKYYSEEGELPGQYILSEGDILVTMTDLSKDGDTLGYPIKVPKIQGKVLLHNQRLGKVLIKNHNLISEYLYWMMCTREYRNEVLSSATGTTVRHTSPERIMKYKFKLPEVEQQLAISNILSTLDKKIELNNEMNKTLEEMAQALFKRWFIDFEFPNENGEPYKSSGGEMVESDLGMIPKGWNITKLEKVITILTKSEKPFENPKKVYEHFSIPAYDSNLLPIFEEGNLISSNKYKVDNNCILISKLNPSTKRLWNPFCVTDNSICSTEFIVFKPEDISFKPFYYELINTDKFYDYMVSHATGSTGSRQRIKPKETLAFEFVMPPNEIIDKVCNVIHPLHEKSQRLLQENKELENLRNSLLPKLMSGEIKVDDYKS